MPNIGPLELAIVLVIALIVFGPKRLPELGRSVGRGMREFKNSVSGKEEPEDKPEIESGGEIESGDDVEAGEPVEGEVVTHNRT